MNDKLTTAEADKHADEVKYLVDALMKDSNRTMNRAKMFKVAATILSGHMVAKAVDRQNELLQGIKEILFIRT